MKKCEKCEGVTEEPQRCNVCGQMCCEDCLAKPGYCKECVPGSSETDVNAEVNTGKWRGTKTGREFFIDESDRTVVLACPACGKPTNEHCLHFGVENFPVWMDVGRALKIASRFEEAEAERANEAGAVRIDLQVLKERVDRQAAEPHAEEGVRTFGDAQGDLEELKSKFDRTVKENHELCEKVSDLKSKLHASQIDVQNMQNELRIRRSSSKTIHPDVAECMAENEQLNNIIAERDDELKKLKGRNEQLQDQLADSRTKVIALEQAKIRLEHDLIHRYSTIDHYRHRINDERSLAARRSMRHFWMGCTVGFVAMAVIAAIINLAGTLP